MSRRLQIRVAPDGSITAETLGYTGQECLDAIGVLEDLLDATTTSSRFTAGYTAGDTVLTSENDDELHTHS
jgi:hypothetical protein